MTSTPVTIRSGLLPARLAAAILLVVAGVLKVATQPAGPAHGVLADLPPWARSLQVILEIGFGGWLLIGYWPALSRWAAIALFAGFAAYALGNLATRNVDCGCFGALSIPPGVLLFVNISVAALFYWGRPGPVPPSAKHPLPYLVVWFWVGVAGYSLSDPSGAGVRANAPDPASWIGRRLPMLDQIDIRDRIAAGSWLLVFHRHGCRACQEALPQVERAAREDRADPARPRTALVEVPPFEAAGSTRAADYPSCWIGRLDPARDWRIATPTMVGLRDGIVTDVRPWDGSFTAHAAGDPPAE